VDKMDDALPQNLVPPKRAERRAAESAAHGGSRKYGWRVHEWHPAAGVSRSYTYLLIGRGEIKSRMIGKMRIIVTPPDEWLANAGEGQ
jgi:hypothetical protein